MTRLHSNVVCNQLGVSGTGTDSGAAAGLLPPGGGRSAARAAPARWLWSPPSDPVTAGVADASGVAPRGETAAGAHGFTDAELAFFMTLDTPGKVQDYLDAFPLNHEVSTALVPP